MLSCSSSGGNQHPHIHGILGPHRYDGMRKECIVNTNRLVTHTPDFIYHHCSIMTMIYLLITLLLLMGNGSALSSCGAFLFAFDFFLNLFVLSLKRQIYSLSLVGSGVTLGKLFNLFEAQCPKLKKNVNSKTFFIGMPKSSGGDHVHRALSTVLGQTVAAEKMESQESSPIILGQTELPSELRSKPQLLAPSPASFLIGYIWSLSHFTR